jgi:transcriptional regulator with XRE-family HTH domain
MLRPSEQLLGQTIRRLREDGGASLKSLAEQAGVSESFLSQVERGVANPSVASLRRIADSLGTSIGALFQGQDGQGRVVRAKERPRMVHPTRRWEDALLTPRSSRRLQVILSVIEPGEGSGDEPYSHDSDEECVVVLKGSLEFGVGPDTYVLEEGDSLTFESRIPHRNRNPGDTKAEVLWIITPPSY